MEHMILWSAVLVLSVAAEALTAALVSVWFIPSAAVCLLLEVCGVTNLGIQIAVFVLLSAALALILRKKAMKSFKRSTVKTNVDALIGKIATVEEDIPQGGVGRVKIGGSSWAAYTEASRSVLTGERVTVEAVSGVRLLCKPEEAVRPDERLVGKTARVEKKIDNFAACGTVICQGRTYLAKAAEDREIAPDTVVEIVSCEDGRLVCRPAEKQLSHTN